MPLSALASARLTRRRGATVQADSAADIGMPALELLLAAGADVCARDSHRSVDFPAGRTALEYADEVTAGKIRKPQLELVKEHTGALKARCAELASRQRLAWARAAAVAAAAASPPVYSETGSTGGWEAVAELVGEAMHRAEDGFTAGRPLVALKQQTVKEFTSYLHM